MIFLTSIQDTLIMGIGEQHTPGVADFLAANWAELLIGLMAFAKIVVNLTPTATDNRVFGWLDTLINAVITDRIKPGE